MKLAKNEHIYKTLSGFLLNVVVLLAFTSCLSYMPKERDLVLIPGVDMKTTLKISEQELAKGRFGSVLTLWAIRDQVIDTEEAEVIREQYFTYIDTLTSHFDIWHITWAISNFYRNGGATTRQVLFDAYDDATVRAKNLGGIADRFANDERLYFGDVHAVARAYAQKHIVVPGNPDYLQTYADYLAQ